MLHHPYLPGWIAVAVAAAAVLALITTAVARRSALGRRVLLLFAIPVYTCVVTGIWFGLARPLSADLVTYLPPLVLAAGVGLAAIRRARRKRRERRDGPDGRPGRASLKAARRVSRFIDCCVAARLGRARASSSDDGEKKQGGPGGSRGPRRAGGRPAGAAATFWSMEQSWRSQAGAAVAESTLLALACVLSYWLATTIRTQAYSASRADGILSGLWAVIATIFVLRSGSGESVKAALSRDTRRDAGQLRGVPGLPAGAAVPPVGGWP